jgi:hypothetical protein
VHVQPDESEEVVPWSAEHVAGRVPLLDGVHGRCRECDRVAGCVVGCVLDPRRVLKYNVD